MKADELRSRARDALDAQTFAFIADAAGDGCSAERNVAAFRERSVVPRIFRDVSAVDTATTLLGTEVAAPVGVAPLPRMNRVHESAERGIAGAAGRQGVVFCAPTNSSVTLEELAAAAGPAWFQLYPHPDEGITADLVRRAEVAGYAAVVVTADRPVAGAKPSEAAKSTSPEDLPNLQRYGREGLIRQRHHPGFGWDDLEALLSTCRLPLVVKGVLGVEDARRAIALGCAAVWVSNHGGRQLDQAAAGLDVVEGIVDAVAGEGQVYLDGGVRRGVDVFIALALGVDAVFVGRPVAYALALGGAPGVEDLIAGLIADLRHTMALSGAAALCDIDRTHVR